LEVAASLPAGEGLAFAEALAEAGLAKTTRPGVWEITQAGQTLTPATAARPVKRATADRALRDFFSRVEEVNRKPSYLGKVVAVVLFGSMLKPEVDLLSDVDVAVEIMPKEADAERARAKNERRARELERLGYLFRGFLDDRSAGTARCSSISKGEAG
jgi:predicted nucleotidyltransferase